MKIVSLLELKPNKSNPRRITRKQMEQLKKSIKDFPEMLNVRPIVVNKEMKILGGNMRYQALLSLNYKEVPVEIVNWSKEKEDEFIIKDNIANGEWDWDILANEWNKDLLEEWGLPIDKDDLFYSRNIEAPIYEPNNEKPNILDLLDNSKAKELVNEIEKADIPEEDKVFLKLASTRHIIFNYSLIADYFAHSSPKVKGLMEKSALVIIDHDKAIENGFIDLVGEVFGIEAGDYDD